MTGVFIHRVQENKHRMQPTIQKSLNNTAMQIDNKMFGSGLLQCSSNTCIQYTIEQNIQISLYLILLGQQKCSEQQHLLPAPVSLFKFMLLLKYTHTTQFRVVHQKCPTSSIDKNLLEFLYALSNPIAHAKALELRLYFPNRLQLN